MLHQCSSCPSSSQDLRNHIYCLLEDFGDNEFIEFKHWITTDQSNLIERKEIIANYVDLAELQLQKLTKHSFLTNSQSRYVKSRKESWEPTETLFMGDCAENY